MSITKIRTSTRPNTNISFFEASDEDIKYISDTYVETGKRISRVVELTNNGLTQLITTVWKDQSAFDEWTAEVVYNQDANNYNTTNKLVN
jgi:hypothetical protein